MDYLFAASQLLPELTEIYRAFHRIPEPSWKEVKTHGLIRTYLEALDIDYEAPAPNITLAAVGQGKKTLGFRADTDALQLTEKTGLPFASTHPGLMHACGHDAHIAVLLGAAKLLKARENELTGQVRLIFQPAEEGELGAQAVMDTGLIDDLDAVYALHVWSSYPAGEMRVSPGGVAASCDMFTLKIHGRCGHGAMPEQALDTIVCASQLILQLQTIVSRFTSPMDPVALTIGSFHAGTRCNIIAGEAVLEGTIRTFDPETYKKVHALFDRMVESCCHACGCTFDLDMRPACPVTWNDEELAAIARAAAGKVHPDGALPDLPSALGDDIAEYAAIAPVCYIKLGVRNEAIGACHPHHSEFFRIDETALPVGAAWLYQIARDWLAKQT